MYKVCVQPMCVHYATFQILWKEIGLRLFKKLELPIVSVSGKFRHITLNLLLFVYK